MINLSKASCQRLKLAMPLVIVGACMVMGLDVYAAEKGAAAAGTAVSVAMVDNLSATVKALINGPAAYIVDGIIIGGAGYASAVMRTPAAIIFGLISCGLFHIAIQLLG